jgi:hypothetical protein
MCNNLKLSYENRFFNLITKGRHVPLSDQEMVDFETVFDYLEIEECDQCEGQGGKDFPSMAGYGWDWLTCKKCEGTAFLNLSPELKEKLKKEFAE